MIYDKIQWGFVINPPKSADQKSGHSLQKSASIETAVSRLPTAEEEIKTLPKTHTKGNVKYYTVPIQLIRCKAQGCTYVFKIPVRQI
jgi:hypothetical protein